MICLVEPSDSNRALLCCVISKRLDVFKRCGIGLPDGSHRDGRQLNYNLRKRSIINSHIGRDKMIVDTLMTAANWHGSD